MKLEDVKSNSENVLGVLCAARISHKQKAFLDTNKISFSVVARMAIDELMLQSAARKKER